MSRETVLRCWMIPRPRATLSLAQLRPDLVTTAILSATVSSFGHLDQATREAFVAERVAPLDAGKSMKDVAQALAALENPTLVIAGVVDPIGRADALIALAEGLSRAEYHCSPGAGHCA